MNKVKKLLKNWLLLRINLAITICVFNIVSYSQVANYVSNGGFEQKINCSVTTTVFPATNWRWIDSIVYGNVGYNNLCYPNVPYGPFGFQYPKSGGAFAEVQSLCQPTLCPASNSRGYIRNRLKTNLIAGKTYCVKFYVNIANDSNYGIDGFGAYFGNNSLDTIIYTNKPLTYLVPQVQNSTNNIITDTLNWTLITGTFVATGIEKHMIIGNFKSDAATTKTLINTTYLSNVISEFYLDDASCIPLDLPAYAGPDLWCVPGNSVFIGRQPDVGIDEDCMWYKLPNTTTAIDTVAGLWVSPIVTTTYIVKQDVCGVIKWDTVVVHQSGTGINELDVLKDGLTVYPQPAKDEITLSFDLDIANRFRKISIYTTLGQLIREEEIDFKSNQFVLKTTDFNNGVYLFTLKDKSNFHISKRFVIAK